MIYKSIFSSPLGFLEICADGGEAVTRLYFTSTPSTDFTKNACTAQAARELEEYFHGVRKDFTFPLEPEGTAFQKQVWKACREIPYGESRSFKQLAAAVGDDKAARKVGAAIEASPIVIAIPTHRVSGKSSLLASLSSEGAIKEALLGAEKNYLKQK